jgi:hypothetical protein
MAVTGPTTTGAVVVLDVVGGGTVEVVAALVPVVGDPPRDERSSDAQPRVRRTRSTTTAARVRDIRVNVLPPMRS